MSKKKLLAINLNEFNLEFLNYGSKKYNCKNIIKFLKLQKIRTYSSDKIQDKNLDPWVQSISINSGIKSKKHKIYNLGENIPENINLYPYLTGVENLDYFSKIAGTKFTIDQLHNFLLECGLSDLDFNKPVSEYSKGMRQKIGIAISYAKNAKIYLLDDC